VKRARRSPGRFIVLEGLDGSGTTTQLARLKEQLEACGHRVHATCEPSNGPIGKLLRTALLGRLGGIPGHRVSAETLALLFAADRREHLDQEVLPALAEGEIVLCDRYVLSSMAYQGQALGLEWVETLNDFAQSPDLTLYVEVSGATAAKRRASRGGEEEIFDDTEKQKRIARTYKKAIARRKRRDHVVVLDGEADIVDVTNSAMAAILNVVGARR
jgi:dTMP kinase